MKKCKYCQSEIDSKAKICPVCHKKQGNTVGLIILIVVVIAIIAAASNGSSSSTNGSSTTKPSEQFTYAISKSYSDGYGYYIEGTVKNNTDKDYSYVQIEFVCYDKSGNNLGTAIDNTNNLLKQETWKYKAMGMFTEGKSVDHCDYHEITSW